MKKKQPVWETKKYYDVARKASLDLTHPALQAIKEHAGKAKKVLEVGCGEGTKLYQLTSTRNESFGIDISQKAIKRAKKNYPKIKFKIADAEKLPFRNNEFDLVFSAFLLEHTRSPEKIILEMIRVCRRYLILVAPNFGAPNRCSPCFTGSRWKKLIKGFIKDLERLIWSSKHLSWEQVIPKATPSCYQIDWDTTIEPYLGDLAFFLKDAGLKLELVSSYWKEIEEQLSLIQKIFQGLARLKIYPFTYWGPHFIVIAKKDL